MSPEIVNGSGHDWSCDMWAAGCLTHELMAGRTPFADGAGDDPARVFKRAVRTRYKPLLPEMELARRKHAAPFVSALLRFEPGDRLTAPGARDHAYFSSLDWPAFESQSFAPEWLPPPRGADYYRDKSNARLPEPYRGDPTLFAVFEAAEDSNLCLDLRASF